MSLSATAICFIACHGGPADHFAVFAEKLAEQGYEVQICASGPALKKFQDRNIKVLQSFDADILSETGAIQIVQSFSRVSFVISDVGHSTDTLLLKTFAKERPDVMRVAYYDNPEPYVPGGYSDVAAKVMEVADKVFYANANLASASSKGVEIGYYPVAQAEKMAARRVQEHDSMRTKLFSENKLEDRGQKVLVYFGGNNTEYFEKAFPAFLNILSQADLSNVVVVLQQHPGAKKENIDKQQLEEWLKTDSATVLLSNKSSDEMQVIADGALYYQTSMGPLFALAGIPTIQVGHKTFEDVLVRGKLCSTATTAFDFDKAVAVMKPVDVTEKKKTQLYQSLGIKEDWFKNLLTNVNKS